MLFKLLTSLDELHGGLVMPTQLRALRGPDGVPDRAEHDPEDAGAEPSSGGDRGVTGGVGAPPS